MKSLKVLVSVAVALSVATSANAATQVWFELTGGAGVPTGAPLELTVDTSTGPTATTWDITAWVSVDPADLTGDLFSWAIDLVATGGPDKLSGSNWEQLSTMPFETPGVGGAAPNIMTGGSAFTFFPALGGTFPMFSFDLTKTKFQGDTNEEWINVIVGANEFGDGSGGGVANIDFAGNGTIAAGAGNDGGGVIHITNIPEPTTLVLLGMGGLALIRRRR